MRTQIQQTFFTSSMNLQVVKCVHCSCRTTQLSMWTGWREVCTLSHQMTPPWSSLCHSLHRKTVVRICWIVTWPFLLKSGDTNRLIDFLTYWSLANWHSIYVRKSRAKCFRLQNLFSNPVFSPQILYLQIPPDTVCMLYTPQETRHARQVISACWILIGVTSAIHYTTN